MTAMNQIWDAANFDADGTPIFESVLADLRRERKSGAQHLTVGDKPSWWRRKPVQP